VRRETENVVLLIVGVAVAMVTVTGAYTRYVKPAMLPWLAVSAVLLIGLALDSDRATSGRARTNTPGTPIAVASSGCW
jgi:hypothetical protein